MQFLVSSHKPSCPFFNLSVSVVLYGSQTAAEYSKPALISVVLAVDISCLGQYFRFRRRKAKVLFVFPQLLLIAYVSTRIDLAFTFYTNKIHRNYSNVLLFYVCQTTEQHQSVFGSDRLVPQQNIQGWNKIDGWQTCNIL